MLTRPAHKRLRGWGVIAICFGIIMLSSMCIAQEQITFWHRTAPEWYMNTIIEAVERFNKSHPEIKVKTEFPGSGAKYREKILVAVHAGTAPDVLQCPPAVRYAMERSGEKIIAPIDELSKNYETELELRDLPSAILDHNRFHGRLMGMPFFTQWEGDGLAYNKDMFREVGLDPESPPESIEELIEYGKKLTRDTNGDGTPDKWGYAVPFGKRTWMVVMFMADLWRRGAKMYSKDFSEVLVNRPEGVKTLQFWVDCYHKYKISDLYAPDLSWMTDLYQYFGSGMVGMSPCSADIGRYSFNFDYGIAPYPYVYAGLKVAQFNTHALVILEQSKHKRAAYEFVRWFMSPQEYPTIVTGIGEFPARYSTFTSSAWKNFLQKNPVMKTFVTFMSDPEYIIRPRPKNPIHDAVRGILRDASQLAVYQKASPQEALNEAAKKIREAINKAKKGGTWIERPAWVDEKPEWLK